MKLLLVEDDPRLAELVAEALSDYGYVVDVARDGEMGWYHATEQDYALIMLDVMLPKQDGITLCQRLRSRGSNVPILMMTARDASTDKVMGLDAGADDYLVKPVDLPELLARIRALLRRGNGSAMPVLTWGNLRLNPSTYQVTYAEQALKLTPKEFLLLQLLLYSGQRVLSRRAIIDHLWSLDEPPTEESVKFHIKSLRQKLKEVGSSPDAIETIRGVGYRLK
ncbi:MAG: response regulator transcription factor [Hydrococcus sp. RM1_1_31]|nr:response regulator transcription factor [Hydrococcus sp. RM1_1_31]